jgi:hypothetical protein
VSIGAFVDKQHQPTIDAMLVSVRSKRRLWERLTQFIDENYRVKLDSAYYGKNYGWALRFRSGGRALAAFYPGAGSFTVQIIIGQAQLEEALQLRLGAKVREILINARAFAEGRWLFIPVESEQDCRRLIAAIFPLYLFLGLTLSDNWHKNIVIGTIAVVIAMQNMFIWITGAWLY